MKTIELSKDLKLPAEDLLESAIGVIGKRGRGKSGGVKVLMEELVGAGLPFVALDPVGVMWGLRSSLDGSGPGLPVLVVGGSHGDLRLERRAGAEIARAVVQANVSCIVDFSEEPKAAYREFVRDFSHELFRVNDTPRIVIVEEAPELVPQKLRPDMADVFEAVERLVSRGRNKGIGVVLVSQRAATINKDVLTQVDALLIFGLAAPQDRKALGEWVESHGGEKQTALFGEGLAELPRQEAWFWAPEAFGGVFKQVRIRDFRTFHPDKTHLRRAGLLKAKPVTTDVTAIVSKLGAQMDRLAKAKTDVASVTKLQAELARVRQRDEQLERAVQDLRGKLASRPASAAELRRAVDEATSGLRKEISETRAQLKRSTAAVARARTIAKTLAEALDAGALGEDVLRMQKAESRPAPAPRPIPRPAVSLVPAEPSLEGAPDLKAGAVRMLRELASRHPLTLTRAQLGTLARFTPSGGTFGTYFSRLKGFGLLEEDASGNVRVTPAGLEFVGEVPSAPTSPEEALAMWKRNLKKGAAAMLQAVVDAGPDGISKEELAERTGFTMTGGTYGTYLSILQRNGLVEVRGEQVHATEMLLEA